MTLAVVTTGLVFYAVGSIAVLLFVMGCVVVLLIWARSR